MHCIDKAIYIIHIIIIIYVRMKCFVNNDDCFIELSNSCINEYAIWSL